MTHLNADTLNLYMDDELGPPERAVAETHLAKCSQCSQELLGLNNLFAMLDNLQPEKIPVDLTREILARVSPMSFIQNRWVVGALLVSQLAIAAALAVWLSPSLSAWTPGELPTFTLVSDTAGWLAGWTASFTGITDLMSINTVLPLLAHVTWIDWSLLIGIAGVIWLAGNYRLLALSRQDLSEVA